MFKHAVATEKILKVQADKRKSKRMNAAFSGAISADNEFICHCVIRDVSNSGMRLSVQSDVDLPEEFDVKTPAVAEVLRVKLQWQKGENFGVLFK